ncbi:MAG: hypothetical protein P8Z37_15355, partial [Acidobacteriota bacterium]
VSEFFPKPVKSGEECVFTGRKPVLLPVICVVIWGAERPFKSARTIHFSVKRPDLQSHNQPVEPLIP